MRSISQVALVLSVLMVVATIDAVPDPPAVAPHTVELKVSCLRAFVGEFREQPLTGDLTSNSHAPIRQASV